MIVLHALRSYARRISRHPASAILAIVSLALGIGATTAVFSAIRGVLYEPLPYPAVNRLVAVGESENGTDADPVGYQTYLDWSASLRSFSSMCAIGTRTYLLAGGGDPEEIRALGITHPTFRTFGVRPILGRDFTADDDRRDSPRRVLLSAELWARRFGSDPSIVGRTIRMSDVDFEVIGVMPAGVRIRSEEWRGQPVGLWTALRYDTTLPYACRDCRHLHVFGRLRDGVSPAAASQETAAFTDRLRTQFRDQYPAAGKIALVPFVDRVAGEKVRSTLWSIASLALLVLLLAVANATSIRLASLVRRRNEISVRLALGGSPLRVAALLVSESVIESTAAALIGLTCAAALIAAFRVRAAAFLPRAADLKIDSGAVAVAIAIGVVAGVLAGVLPALRARRWSLREAHRGIVSPHRSAQAALVAVNVAIAFGLLAGSLLLARSLVTLFNIPPGFDADHVLSFRVSASPTKYGNDDVLLPMYRRFLRDAEQQPGVGRVALTTQLPFYDNTDNASMIAEERASAPASEAPGGQRFGVSAGYFDALRIPLRAGRLFTDRDTAKSEPVIILNERAAEVLWPHQNAVGRKVRMGGGEGNPFRRVVGIVGNVLAGDLGGTPPSQAYLPLDQFSSTDTLGVARISGAADAATLRQRLRAIDPDIAFFDAKPMRSLVAASESRRTFVLSLLAIFSVVALVLALLGVYGIVALLASSRTHEIALRMVLGSTSARVVRLMLEQGLRLALAGIGAGLVLAVVVGQFLESFLFRVQAGDPLTLAAVTVLLLGASLVACAFPSIRAAKVSPAEALREV